MKGVVLGVGINDSAGVKGCQFYSRWLNMLKRCYSEKYHQRQPSYKGCTVCPSWLTFSNFKLWMMGQDWEGMELDKDILFEGNKLYSPETCVFISKGLNTFLSDRGAERGGYPLGVGLHKPSGLYRARCGDGNGDRVSLGYFTTPDQAHQAWISYKTGRLISLSNIQRDPRVKDALINNKFF